MFDYIFWHLGPIWLGIAIWELAKYLERRWRDRRNFPYRWKCPRCNFTLKGATLYEFEISKSSHNHSRLREFRER